MGRKNKNIIKQRRKEEEAASGQWEIMGYVRRQQWVAFFSTLVWGLAAHGYMFLNKFSWHDDAAHAFGVGGSYTLGRWFLGILGEWVQKYLGNVSLPWFNGMACLLLIAAGNMLLVEMFHLKRASSCILLGALMAVFPSWTSTYGYMFTAPYYAFAVFLALLGAYLVWAVRKPWLGILAGAVCQCLSLGIYQAYLPLASTVLLISFLNEVIMEPEKPIWKRFRKGLFMAISLFVGIVFYLIANHTVLTVKGISLSDYQNVSKMGQTDLKALLNGVLWAWKDFIVPVKGGIADMYMQSVRSVYYMMLCVTILFFVWHMIQCIQREKSSFFFLLGGLCCFPVGINLLYLMGEIDVIYSIMLYTKVMIFIFPIVLIERFYPDGLKIKKCSMLFLSVVLLYVAVFYTHYANVCYLQADFQQSTMISWMTSLATRIEGTEGYEKELPIAYVNEGNMNQSVRQTNELSTEIVPYGSTLSRWKISLYRWCGFRHEEVTDLTGIESLPEVQAMPSYPSAGSIQIVNGVIVVKF